MLINLYSDAQPPSLTLRVTPAALRAHASLTAGPNRSPGVTVVSRRGSQQGSLAVGVDNPGVTTTATTTIDRSGPAIQTVLANLAPQECAQFEAEFHHALAQANEDFDTSRVDALIGRWWARAIVLLNPDPQANAAWERIKGGDTSELVKQWRPQPDGSLHVYRKIADGWAFSHVQSTG